MREYLGHHAGKIIAVGGTVALFVFVYVVICFFRRDWVRYDTVVRRWEVESMQCAQQQAPLRIIHLYKNSNLDRDSEIRYTKAMHVHLNQQHKKSLAVERKLIGYLLEWDYGTVLPLTIAGKYVDKKTLIPDYALAHCKFKPADIVAEKKIDTRRKMR